MACATTPNAGEAPLLVWPHTVTERLVMFGITSVRVTSPPPPVIPPPPPVRYSPAGQNAVALCVGTPAAAATATSATAACAGEATATAPPTPASVTPAATARRVRRTGRVPDRGCTGLIMRISCT